MNLTRDKLLPTAVNICLELKIICSLCLFFFFLCDMFNTPLDCDWPLRLDSWANVLLAVKKMMPWIMRVKDTWHASSLKYKNLISLFLFVLTLKQRNEWKNKETICIFISVWCSKNTIQVFQKYSWDLSIFCIFLITFSSLNFDSSCNGFF